MAPSNLAKMGVEELIALQQDISVKRGEAERAFREEAQAVQFEIDKKVALAQFGSLTPAQREALAELASQDEQDEEE